MIKLIRKYQRWGLAFFGVLLMLTFLGNKGNSGPTDRADTEIGRLNGKPITFGDISDARSELGMIEKLQIDNPYGKEYPPIALTRMVQFPDQATFQKMDENPEMFLLLRNEARANAPQPNALEIENILSQQGFTPQDTGTDPYIAARQAITDLLWILENFSQHAAEIRVSTPWLNHALADQQEKIGIDFVQLSAADYAAKVPPPTTQQCQEQFTRFADVAPGRPTGGNPFGFGYKLPLRARVQYIRISRPNVTAAVIARMDSFHWDIEGRKYYHSHLEDFHEAPATNPSTKPVAAPAIKPYEKVRDEVLATIRQPMIDALNDQVESYLSSTLTTAWQAYHQYAADPGTPPGPEPDTSLGQRYTSFSFLRRLAEEVQSRFNVVINVDDTNRPLPISELLQAAGFHNQLAANFVSAQASAYLASADKTALPTIAQLMRPSAPIQGVGTDPVVIPRLISVLAPEAPKDITTSLDQVQADLRSLASYNLAKTDADKLLTAAKNGALASTAAAMGKSVRGTPPGMPLSMDARPRSAGDFGPLDVIQPPLDNIDHAAGSTQSVDRPNENAFIRQAFDLLSKYDPKITPHPARLIEFQPQARLFVAQLTTVDADWTAQDYYRAVLETRADLVRAQLPALAPKWFSYDAVIQRTGYQSDKPASPQKPS